MRRRVLLAALTTGLAGVAGCIGDSGGGSPTGTDGSEPDTETPTGTDGDETDADTPADTATPTESGGGSSTPPSATDVFAEFDCPSFDDTARTVCYHDVDSTDAPLVVTAEPEVFDPDLTDDDVESLDFVLYNRSEWSVGFNPYDWGIERYDDGEWTHVAPEMYPEPWTRLSAGEAFTWSLPSEPHPSPTDEQHRLVDVALDPGVYAFHVSVSYERHDTDADDGHPEGRTELIALFQVEQAIRSGSEDDGVSTKTGG